MSPFPDTPSSVWSPPTPLMELDGPFGVRPDPSFLSEDDIQRFFSTRARYMYDRFESSPPRESWDATHPQLPDSSRCSLLIHEVSLLVGLAPEDEYPSDDSCYLVPDRPKQVPDILPLTLTPTKSLASRKLGGKNVQAGPVCLPTVRQRPHSPSLPHDRVPLARLPRSVTPPVRQRNLNRPRPSLSPRRRQGQVFHFEDDTFVHPREPPPKPPSIPLANRCSSLDRLERSLLKLEAHAPHNHRKSQSEEHSPRIPPAQRLQKRPSLPSPRKLRKEQSCLMAHRNASHLVVGCHASEPPLPPLPLPVPGPRPAPIRPHVAPLVSPTVSAKKEVIPTSFMDMDLPCDRRQAASRQPTSKEKMKTLVGAAKRASRGVLAWGKHFTATRPSVAGQPATACHTSRV